MYGNSGYIGSSRSVRSLEAINNYEVPISLLNKDLIEQFLAFNRDDFKEEDFNFLKKLTIAKWKYIAQNEIGASSWHHTGKYFNITDHYSLFRLARKAIEIKDELDERYNEYKNKEKIEKESEKLNFKYGVISVQNWSGTRSHPKRLDDIICAGIVKGDWLYYLDGNENSYNTAKTKKYKIYAKKVNWLDCYDNYEDLAKRNEDYKSTKGYFDTLIKNILK